QAQCFFSQKIVDRKDDQIRENENRENNEKEKAQRRQPVNTVVENVLVPGRRRVNQSRDDGRKMSRRVIKTSAQADQIQNERNDRNPEQGSVLEPGLQSREVSKKSEKDSVQISRGLVASAATTAAAAAAAAEAATSAAAAFTRSHRTSFVDRHRTSAVVGAVELADSFLSFIVIRHFDETEAFAAAGVAIGDDLRGLDRSTLTENFSQRFFGGRKRKITYIQ